MTSLIDYRSLLCAERRWHLPLRCDTGTVSGVSWVIGAWSGPAILLRQKSWNASCSLLPQFFRPPDCCLRRSSLLLHHWAQPSNCL